MLELLRAAIYLDSALVREATRRTELLTEIIQLKGQLAAKDTEIESMYRGLDGNKSADKSVHVPPSDITPDVSLLPGDYIRPLAHVQTPISVHTLDKALADAMAKISDLEFNSSKHTSLIGNMRMAHESLAMTVERVINKVDKLTKTVSELETSLGDLAGSRRDVEIGLTTLQCCLERTDASLLAHIKKSKAERKKKS